MNLEELRENIKNLGIDLSENQLNMLNSYAHFLLEYNIHTNLTAIKDEESVYLKHFYDSLTIIKAIDLNDFHNLIDIGTGAGFPGMVLAIMYPHLKVDLLDSNNKKIKFLNELIKKLDLKNVQTINERSEIYAKKNIDKYDIVVSRAVANLKILSELCLPLTKEGGYFIALKGSAKEEVKESLSIINKLNAQIEQELTFTLPKEGSMRTIIKIRKIGPNPQGYPRNFKKIKNDK